MPYFCYYFSINQRVSPVRVCSHILFFVNMSFVGAGGQIKFHCAMKEIYEMPQMTVVEMELEEVILDGQGSGIQDGGDF